MEILKAYLSWILRLILACTFLYAAISKIIYPDDFFNSVRNYQLTPDPFSYLVAYFLPAFEIIVAILLFSPRFFSAAILSMEFLLIIFILALISVWIRGLDINCGCFGGGVSGMYGVAIFRDVILLLICFILNLPKLRKKYQY